MPDGSEILSKADELMMEGSRYHREGNFDAARLHYDGALLLDPQHPTALQNLSGILLSTGQYHASLSIAKRAIDAAPNNIGAHANYAAALTHLGRYAESRKIIETTVFQQFPNEPGQLHNHALVCYMMGDIETAIRSIEKSFENSNSVPAGRLSDYGIFTLASGDVKRGLERYESRWLTMQKADIWKQLSDIPEWRGENIWNKRILVHHEQGFGDGIMLSRFVHDLIFDFGADVTLAVPSELIRLYKANFNGVPMLDWGTELPSKNFDFHAPMLSVMRYIGREKISTEPYMGARNKFEGSLGPNGFRVGIVWESGDHGPISVRRRRVIPFDLFFPLAEIPNVRLVSLQKGPAQQQILNSGAESFVFDPMGRAWDWLDTAEIIDRLDLIVSVDSAVVHLAGAMGKHVLMLGPYTRCWRWWESPSGRPWYNNVEIFQQSKYGRWEAEMQDVAARVRELAGC